MYEALLINLINAASTNAEGELAAASVLKDFFKDSDIETRIDVWDNTRANFTAKIKAPAPDAKSLIFFSHLDVVPVKNQTWHSSPFTAIKQDGKIYGRGAVDMKGPIAAAAASMKRIAASGCTVKNNVILAATAGEETDSCGITRMLKTEPHIFNNAAGIIVTEPTQMEMVTSHKGIFWLSLTTKGVSAHSSAPHLGSNAIYKMCKLISALEKLDLGFAPHPALGSNTISVNTINGGIAANIVPDTCRTEVDIRLLPGQKTQDVLAKINAVFDKLKAADPKFEIDCKVIRNVAAFETNCGAFVPALGKLLNKTPRPINFTTDAPYLSALGAAIVIMGPGRPDLCHKPDEYIETERLCEAVDAYSEIIKHFCL